MNVGDVEIVVDGTAVVVEDGTTVASALLNRGTFAFRTSTTGEVRGPVCGMGVCYECRVTIDGIAHRRACMTPVARGMRVSTRGSVE